MGGTLQRGPSPGHGRAETDRSPGGDLSLSSTNPARTPVTGADVGSGSVAGSLGRVAELADAQDSGSCVRKDVGVQVPPRPPGAVCETSPIAFAEPGVVRAPGWSGECGRDRPGSGRDPAGRIDPIRGRRAWSRARRGAPNQPVGRNRRRVRRRAGRPSGADRASRCTSPGCHAAVGGGSGERGHPPGRHGPAGWSRTLRSSGGWRRRPPARR